MSKNNSKKQYEPDVIHTLIEKVNTNKVLDIFRSDLKIDYLPCIYTLISYLESGGKLTVPYYTVEDREDGRLEASNSAMRLLNGIRAYIFKDTHYDIDFKNCHPTLAYHILTHSCGLGGYNVEAFSNYKKYIDDRTELVANGVISKKEVLVFLNDPKINVTCSKSSTDDILRQNILKEAVLISTIITQKFQKKFFDVVETYERSELDRLFDTMQSNDITVASLIKDGLLVEKCNIKKLNNVIESFNQFSKTGLVAALKPWKPVELNIENTNRFDFEDPTISNDISKVQAKVYSSPQHIFAENYQLFKKVIRMTDSPNFILKKGNRQAAIIKKLDYPFKIPKGRTVPLKSVLEVCPQLFQVDRLTYFQPSNEDEFSIFPGFLVNDKDVQEDYEDHIKPILHHLLAVWSDNDEIFYNFILDWFAAIVQKQPFKTETLIVLYGEEGDGKSCLYEFIEKKIFGSLALTLTGSDKLTRSFNSHLSGKLLVCLEELRGDNDKTSNHDLDRIKALITQLTIDIEKKGIDVITDNNSINMIGFTNNPNPIRAVKGVNRRLVQKTTSSIYKGNRKYFTEFKKYLDTDPTAAQCFYTFLKNRKVDISKLLFDKPETEEKFFNQWMCMNPIDKTIYHILNDNDEVEISSADFINIIPPCFANIKPSRITVGRRLRKLNFDVKTINGCSMYTISKDKFKIEKSLMDVYISIKGDQDFEKVEKCVIDP